VVYGQPPQSDSIPSTLLIIIDKAYEHKYEMEKNDGKADFNFYKVDIGNRHLVRDATQFVLIDTDNTNDARPERLQAILEEICRDRTFVMDMKNWSVFIEYWKVT
jgi:hypothetical protein